MDTYERYLVQKSDKKYGETTIDAVAFSMFLTDFVKGTVEDRVDMYTEFLKKNDEEEITITDLQEVNRLILCPDYELHSFNLLYILFTCFSI